MESRRNPGPASLHHHDAVIGRLRGAGFSVEMAVQHVMKPGYEYASEFTFGSS